MSVLPKESIKVLAEQSGISNVSDEVAAALVSDVEYRLREIIQVYLPFTTRERERNNAILNGLLSWRVVGIAQVHEARQAWQVDH
jgi:hypothetical protein